MEYSTTLEMNKQATCLDMDALNRKANPESALFTEILEHRKIPHKYIYFFRVEVVSCICNVLSLSPSFLPSVLLKQEKKKNTRHIWKVKASVTGLWVLTYLLY